MDNQQTNKKAFQEMPKIAFDSEFIITETAREFEQAIAKVARETKVFETKTENWPSIIETITVLPDTQVAPLVSVLNRVEDFESFTQIVIKDGLVIISGKPKQCKSKAAYYFAAVALEPGTSNGPVAAPDDGSDSNLVVIFDTEQPYYNCWVAVNTVKKLVKHESSLKNLRFFTIRQYNYRQRLWIIEQFLYSTPGIKMLVIDGIRDLISDPNSGEEANSIATTLLKWATELGIAIITVLHQNKVDSNIRGHIGTELGNKADTVIGMERGEDSNGQPLFTVKPIMTRNREFTPFSFTLDNDGTPVISSLAAPSKGSALSSFEPEDLPESFHRELLESVAMAYAGTLPGWSDLMKKLQKELAVRKGPVGENKCREFVRFYLQKGWLVKEQVPNRSYGGYRYVAAAG